ncbi:class I SAM-dependent methyltransferase [Kineosporia babensis]|uniref:Class I SAM-dependent methyltransferase n=1 Tax=Kineosporia babensis TaxID=499548 RepID=A0A9X1SWR9_9ACTN|nr:class I SAM-dependent methyltransferase [Kineosporia babensis]MCD5315086.1 class I SAM-dependent methyltransferase [Kineosporia babensis]
MNDTDPLGFWDNLYAGRPAVRDPRPNARLTEIVSGLPIGDALDLGCGAGGDALWLARQGWKVTATDISPVAVSRLAELARSLNLPITAEQHELGQTFPAGRFDLVSAHYFHTPFALDRVKVLRTAAEVLNPGGHLLIVDHGSVAPWSWDQDATIPSVAAKVAELALEAPWTVERAAALNRLATGPNGQSAEVTDHVILIRRVR